MGKIVKNSVLVSFGTFTSGQVGNWTQKQIKKFNTRAKEEE